MSAVLVMFTVAATVWFAAAVLWAVQREWVHAVVSFVAAVAFALCVVTELAP